MSRGSGDNAVAGGGRRTTMFTRPRLLGAGSRTSARDQHSRLLGAYEEMALGWFWATDAEGQITYITESVSTLLTGEPHGLIGRDLITLFRSGDADIERRRTLGFQ